MNFILNRMRGGLSIKRPAAFLRVKCADVFLRRWCLKTAGACGVMRVKKNEDLVDVG
jgi:hypothetical protein